MPHLRLIDVDEATGLLKEEYDAAIGRAGKVFNIVKSMSLRPGVLKRRWSCTRRSCSARRGSRARSASCSPSSSRAGNDCHY